MNMRNKVKFNRYSWHAPIVVAFLLSIYLPIIVYGTNRESIDISIYTILLYGFLVFIGLASIFSLLGCFPIIGPLLSKSYPVISVVVFALIFFPNYTGELSDMQEFSGVSETSKLDNLLQLAKLILFFVGSIILYKFYSEFITTKIQVYFFIVSCIPIAYYIFTSSPGFFDSDIERIDGRVGKFSEMGKKENLLIVVFDAFTGYRMVELFNKRPALKRDFPGFVFYPNALASALNTPAGNSAILTGDLELAIEGGSVKARNTQSLVKSYMNDAVEIGFDSAYSSPLRIDRNVIKDIDVFFPNVNRPDKDQSSLKGGITTYISFLSISSTRIIPLYFSKYITDLIDKINSINWIKSSTETEWDIYEGPTKDKRKLMDKFYFEAWLDELHIGDKNKVVRYMFTKLSHSPWVFDSHGRYIEKPSGKLSKESAWYFVDLMIKIVGKINKLGIYNSTTIIFTADHGWLPINDITMDGVFGRTNYARMFNPLIMVKPKGEISPMRESQMTVWLGDVSATARDALGLPAAKNKIYPTRSLIGADDLERRVNIPLFTRPKKVSFHSALKKWKMIPASGKFHEYIEFIPGGYIGKEKKTKPKKTKSK